MTRAHWSIVFFVLAALAVAGALSLILQRHPIHSALSLIVVMVSLAGLYLLLGAEFVAAVQIIVYGGAIMVLFVFVIMLLNAGDGRTHQHFARLRDYVGLPLACRCCWMIAAGRSRARRAAVATAQAQPSNAIVDAGRFPLLTFPGILCIPLKLTSFLILVAILGAICPGAAGEN